jgi:phenylacetate-CoA ligase
MMIPPIETADKKGVEAYQLSRLKELLTYVSANSKFYRKLDPTKIKSLEDLALIPPTTKNDVQNFNWDFLCVPREKVIDYTSTSGTLGKPVFIALTAKDLQRLAYNEFISFSCADGSPGDLYQLMLTLDRQFMAGVAYYEGIQKLGAGVIRVGPGAPALQLETIAAIKPTAIVGVPSFLAKLADFAKRNNIAVNNTSVKKIICIGENIRDASFGLNALGRKISEEWNAKLYSTYASTEMQTAFTECKHGRGGHSHPELIITEVLDENDRPVINDAPGELTITTLGVEGMPLIRYKTGDIVQLHYEPCACGRTTPRISPVLGRQAQMIKLKGTTIYPPGIFDILNGTQGVNDFVVEAFRDELDTDQLLIYISARDADDVKAKLRQNFQAILRVVPEIVFKSQQEIEAMQFKDGGRKPTRFLDRR